MIVMDEPMESLVLVLQRDHAVMCAGLARHWRRPTALARTIWDRFIDAMRHHDDGWEHADQTPARDQKGRPLDFINVPTLGHVGIWRQSVELAGERDRYGGLLVALHARLLYTTVGQPSRQDEELAQEYVGELDRRIDRTIQGLAGGKADQRDAVQPDNLQIACRLFSLFDRLSLALLGGIPWLDRHASLTFGDRTETITFKKQGEIVAVDPWPWEVGELTIGIPCVRLAQSRFGSTAQLQAQLAAASQTQRRWTLAPV